MFFVAVYVAIDVIVDDVSRYCHFCFCLLLGLKIVMLLLKVLKLVWLLLVSTMV